MVVITSGPVDWAIVNERIVCLAFGLDPAQESVAVTPIRKLPKLVGVPLKSPAVVSVIPVGRVPEVVHLIGEIPPEVWSWKL